MAVVASPARSCASGLRSRLASEAGRAGIQRSLAELLTLRATLTIHRMFILVQRVLGLTPRELARTLPLFAYLFLTMAGSVASKAARDALFLDRYAATDLPYVDIAIAVLVGLL